jgi:MFS family permease
MQFFIFLFINIFYSIGLIGTRPVISLYAYSFGATEVTIGLLVSIYAFIPMLVAVRIGRWLDQYGARFMVTLGGTGMLLAFLIPIVYPHLITLFISQFFMGCSHIFVLMSMQKVVGNLPGDRDKLIATFSLTGSAGDLLGPLIGGFGYQHFGFQATFTTFLLFVLAALLIGLILPKAFWKNDRVGIQEITTHSGSTWHLLQNINLRKALIISGLVLYSKDLFVAFFPIYGSRLGMQPGSIGIIISIMACFAILVRVLQFQLVKKFGRSRVLTTTLMLSGLSFLFIAFTSIPWVLGLCAAMLGAGLGLGQPLSLVYALNVSPGDRQGEVLGLRLTFNRASQFGSPFVFGIIGQFLGIAPIFMASGGVLLFGAYFTRLSSSGKHRRLGWTQLVNDKSKQQDEN